MVNRMWHTAVAGEGDSVSFSLPHRRAKSVNPGQILLFYGTRYVTDSEGGGRPHSNGGSSSKFQQMKRHSLKKLASWKSQLSSLAGSRSERGCHRGHTDYGAVSTAPDGHQVTTGGDAQPGLPPFYLLKYYFRSYTSSLLLSALNSQEKLISVTYCRRRHSAYPSF